MRALACAFVLSLVWISVATTRAEPPAGGGAAAFSIQDVAFLAGAWSGELSGSPCEEYWTPPRARSMLGAFRLMRDGRTVMTEHIVIEEAEDGVTLRFKHYSPGFIPWEKEAPLTFRLVEAEPGRALLRSPEASQSPNELEYSMEDGALRVRVATAPPNGEPEEFTLRLTRMAGG